MVKHKKEDPFKVMELFGPTIQGEGTDIGRETIFLRLYGCNLSCVWCDTAHSWDESLYYKGIYEDYSIDDLIRTIKGMSEYHGINHLVITGGEPLMHNHEALTNLVGRLKDEGGIDHVTFETNGTILPHKELAKVTGLFSVSPKLSSSKNPPYKPSLLERWIDRVGAKIQFKFVIANQEDADEAALMLFSAHDERLKYIPIIFQPEESADNYRKLIPMITFAFQEAGLNKQEFDIRYIPQIHKMFGFR